MEFKTVWNNKELTITSRNSAQGANNTATVKTDNFEASLAEIQLLQLIDAKYKVSQIMKILDVSENTLDSHKRNIKNRNLKTVSTGDLNKIADRAYDLELLNPYAVIGIAVLGGVKEAQIQKIIQVQNRQYASLK